MNDVVLMNTKEFFFDSWEKSWLSLSDKEEIKETLKLAEGVEAENTLIKNENKKLNFQVGVLREERNLLVEELNQKKLLLLKLSNALIEERRQSEMKTTRPRNHSLSDRAGKSTLPK